MVTNTDPDRDDDVSPAIAAALQHPRRREVVEQLRAQDGALSIVALAGRLAADTAETLPDVVIELHDRHLPELSRCDLVAYDDDTGVVSLVAASEVVEAAVAHAQRDDG